MGEAEEPAAEFQWLTAEESANLTDEQRKAVESELADVLIYLVRLADELEVDLPRLHMRRTRPIRSVSDPGHLESGRTPHSDAQCGQFQEVL